VRRYTAGLILLAVTLAVYPVLVRIGMGPVEAATAAKSSCKLFVVAAASVVFFAVTAPGELVVALRAVRAPRGLTLALAAGLQSIPIAQDEVERVVRAQRARGLGVQLGLGGLRDPRRTLTAVRALLVPCLSGMLAEALRLTIAVHLRCLSDTRGWASPVLQWGLLDMVVAAYAVAVPVLCFLS
jgi:energy-coupling factor transport system permease protein